MGDEQRLHGSRVFRFDDEKLVQSLASFLIMMEKCDYRLGFGYRYTKDFVQELGEERHSKVVHESQRKKTK